MSAPRPLSAGDWSGAAGVVLIWGLNFVVMKIALRDFGPMLLGALRFIVASLPFIAFLPRPRLPWRFLAGYGLAQGLGQFGFLFLGLKLGMPAGMASVVMQSQAVFTMLLAAPLLGERAKPMQWLGMGVAACGLAAIGLSHGEGPGDMTLVGFVLTLGSGLMWAASNLIVRFAAQRAPRYDPLAFIAWSSLAPVLPFALLALWLGGSAEVSCSQTYYCDITHPEANKGHGIAALSAALDIPLEETAAIGDMPNDIPMLRQAGMAIAMGQAPATVKAEADWISATNDEDGAARAIERVLLPEVARHRL